MTLNRYDQAYAEAAGRVALKGYPPTPCKSYAMLRPLEPGKIVWEESTPNHHVAYLDEGHNVCIEVIRNRSWKKLGLVWNIVMFGNPHTGFPPHDSLDSAKRTAEIESLLLIRLMAERMGME